MEQSVGRVPINSLVEPLGNVCLAPNSGRVVSLLKESALCH